MPQVIQGYLVNVKPSDTTAESTYVSDVVAAATAAFKSTAMYDGPGGQETPKLGSMSDGAAQYKKGMPYYKGKISYGHNSGMKMNGYARAGLAGKGLSMNSQQKISKHMSSGMYDGKKK